MPPYPRAVHECAGLHWRTTRSADTNASGDLDLDQWFYYDADWRLLEERSRPAVDDEDDEETITQRIWCPLYIDALIAFQVDSGAAGSPPALPDGDLDNGVTTYAVLDRRFDVLVTMNSDGGIIDRLRYTAYGEARLEHQTDINGDVQVDTADLGLCFNAFGKRAGEGGYDWQADVNFDGKVDTADSGLLLGEVYAPEEPIGQLARGAAATANSVGYCGYVYDGAARLWLARNRWMDPETGKWLTRDPLGFADSGNLYEYCISDPMNHLDPLGTAITSIDAAFEACLRRPTPGAVRACIAEVWEVLGRQGFGKLTNLTRKWTHRQVESLKRIYKSLGCEALYQHYTYRCKNKTKCRGGCAQIMQALRDITACIAGREAFIALGCGKTAKARAGHASALRDRYKELSNCMIRFMKKRCDDEIDLPYAPPCGGDKNYR